MAKKQTRRSISVSRNTYEKLKAFCEVNNISMSQFVETRVGDFLGEPESTGGAQPRPATAPRPAPRPVLTITANPPAPGPAATKPSAPAPAPAPKPAPVVPMTSAAARYAVEPPPPILKPKNADQAAPKPVAKTADQIFTF